VQERFASIITACTDERGVVDKTKLLELLRLSPEDPVTLIFDVLIANIEISKSISESGERQLIQAENIMDRQKVQAETLLSELKAMPSKIDRLLEVSSGKTLFALDEMRLVAQRLRAQSEYYTLESKRLNLKSAILYFLIGFIFASILSLFFIQKNGGIF